MLLNVISLKQNNFNTLFRGNFEKRSNQQLTYPLQSIVFCTQRNIRLLYHKRVASQVCNKYIKFIT